MCISGTPNLSIIDSDKKSNSSITENCGKLRRIPAADIPKLRGIDLCLSREITRTFRCSKQCREQHKTTRKFTRNFWFTADFGARDTTEKIFPDFLEVLLVRVTLEFLYSLHYFWYQKLQRRRGKSMIHSFDVRRGTNSTCLYYYFLFLFCRSNREDMNSQTIISLQNHYINIHGCWSKQIYLLYTILSTIFTRKH
jgi:hypothetical protein